MSNQDKPVQHVGADMPCPKCGHYTNGVRQRCTCPEWPGKCLHEVPIDQHCAECAKNNLALAPRKSCPFCGHNASGFTYIQNRQTLQCANCGACGPSGQSGVASVETDHAATQRWNTRNSGQLSCDGIPHSFIGQSHGWAYLTMRMINKLTPDIKGKAFDPDWFQLFVRLEEAERRLEEAERKMKG